MVTSFKYLGLLISAPDYYWTALIRILVKAQVVWQRLTRIISRERETPWVPIFFFKSMVQLVLIFGAETWVVTPRIGRFLGGLQDQVARRLTGRLPRKQIDIKWE